ncbi:hypothetical protein AYY16_09865 [Morganella psychrotolerans]|nr:hypothetical protein AYY16_09865 [Morganella psychrotolerans]
MFFSPETQLAASAPMKRVFCSLKLKWVPENGYGSLSEATKDISSYLMEYCSQRRPHSYYQDLTQATGLTYCPEFFGHCTLFNADTGSKVRKSGGIRYNSVIHALISGQFPAGTALSGPGNANSC